MAWGRLPWLCLSGALGLLLVAVADTAARTVAEWAEPLFWAGLFLLFLPVAVRLIAPFPSREERVGLVTVLGLGLYLVKVMHSPLGLTFHDEFLHWRTADDIVRSGRLFAENPLLPVSAVYPALEIVTSALVSVGGMSIFEAGIVLLGVARLVLVLALYLFFEQLSGSPRAAGIATLLYMANPNFVFFDAQFSYESLALPFAAFVLFATVRRGRALAGSRRGFTVAAVSGIVAVAITHHLTAYVLTAFLVLWTATGLIIRWVRGRAGREGAVAPGWLTVLAVVTNVVWFLSVAQQTLGYVVPVLGGGIDDLVRWITGVSAVRRPFSTFGRQASPLWEQVAGYVAILLLLTGIPFGLLEVWRRYRTSALALALASVAFAYPPSLALRLTERGAETSNRAAEFLFAALGFVLAVAVTERWAVTRRWTTGPRGFRGQRSAWARAVALSGAAVTILMGGTIIGWGFVRLPGPYLVGADARSVDPQGTAAAEWTRAQLGPNNRLAADRLNGLLQGSYGRQRPVSAFVDNVGVGPLFMSPRVGPEERAILRRGRIRYVVIDRRLSSGLPSVGIFVEAGEPDALRHTVPIEPAALAKFDDLAGVNRLFDSGDIVIYDVADLARVP